MKPEGMQHIDTVFNAIEEYAMEIDDIQQKSYLSDALVSHISRQTELPELFVSKAVSLFFLAGSV